jgi:rhodanese-related sulfurtransferase
MPKILSRTKIPLNPNLKCFERLPTVVLVILILSSLVASAQESDNSTHQAPPSDIYASRLLENQSTPNISTEELLEILAEGHKPVFDVRTFQEFSISHIPGAVNVAPKPGTSREEYVSDIVEIGRLVKGDKAASMVLYCAGPNCGKSKRVAAELVEAGYTNVSRYQLGIPVWRALGEVTQIELEGARHVAKNDSTAVFIDTREPADFKIESLPGARNIPRSRVELGTFDTRYRAWQHPGGAEIKSAKTDGRLPMEDHNTRMIVFGNSAVEARWVAEALVRNSFHNVSFFAGSYRQLKAALQ